MSLSFGLNVKPKGPPSGPPSKSKPPKKTIFDSDPESDDEPVASGPAEEVITSLDFSTASSNGALTRKAPSKISKPPSKPPPPLSSRSAPKEDFRDLASERASSLHASAASELDPTIYDYDTFHASKSAIDTARKAAAKQDAIDRKPKYIDNLLSAANRRKQDQLVAREKLLQKEREAEGDEFADKEKFVTSAYKAQQEEARRVAEEEEKTREVEERKRREGVGMRGIYKGFMEEEERRHREAVEAGERGVVAVSGEVEDDGGEEVEEARRAGKEVLVNEEGQVLDKRQLLSAGLNVGAKGKKGGGAEHLRTDREKVKEAERKRYEGRGDQKGVRERQTRLMEEQLEASAKRKAEEEEEEKKEMERKAKSQKTEGEVMSAKERYLARKREREEAAKKGG